MTDKEAPVAEPVAGPPTEEAKRALRTAFGTFPTGVTVITTRQSDGTPRGFTANSFSSVSLDPPMLLICIAKTAHSCDVFAAADHFAVNILSEAQKSVSGLFASRQPDKFEQADWYEGAASMPLLSKSLASFVCSSEQRVDAGDHIVLIGRVVDYTTTQGAPLGYYAGNYFSVAMDKPLVAAATRAGNVRIGVILRQDEEVLLEKSEDGKLSLPHAPDGAASMAGLNKSLQMAGLKPSPQALYSVYEDSAAGQQCIFYHGTAEGAAPENMVFIPLDAIPMDQIANLAERSMLARYAREYRFGSFSIYEGDQTSGTVHHVSLKTPSTIELET